MASSANGEWLRVSSCVLCAATVAMFLSGKLLAQPVDRPDLSIELVDSKLLRVCADPNNMPFSTDKGEGFENKLNQPAISKLLLSFGVPLLDDDDRVITEDSIPR
jgi:hypothetical protein